MASRRLRPGTILVALAALALLLTSAAFAAGGPEDTARTVRVGVYQNKPKVFMDENGRAAGLFIELLVESARAEGWTLSFVPCEWAECLRALEDGRIDLMPDVAYSREREQRYDFNRTLVLESWSQVYSKPDASIHTLADLGGKRVAVLQDSVQGGAFEEMMAGFGIPVTIVPTASFEAAFRAVQEGTADAAIANHLFGDYFRREHGLVRTSIVFHAAQLHYATAEGRNQDLLRGIDLQLDGWRREPNSTYYTTLGRWMDRPPVGLVPRRVLWVIGGTVGMLVLAGGMILALRRQVQARTRHLLKANEDLRKVEAELLKSQAILNSAQRLSRVGGWEWDVEKQAATFTEEAYRIHGFAPGDFAPGSPEHIDRSLACYEPEAREAVRTAFSRCRDEGEPWDLEAPFRSSAGNRLWVRSTAEAVRDAQGKVVKVVGNIMDVTDRKTAEEERRRIEDRLRQSQKMEAIGKLAGGIAHDFNNLLTVIINYSELVLRQVKEGDIVRKELVEVVNAGQRAAVLTRQLLAFSRNQVMEIKPVNVNQIALNLENMLRRVIGEDVELRMTLAPDLGVTLADSGQIEQVFMNLVINARDAMPEGGKLTIETSNVDLDEAYVSQRVDVTPGRYVMLCVTDSGCGMDEQTRARAFEPFFTTKKVGKGTGLGLSTVYGIVSQSGGHIWVDSEPGKGTSFKICLRREASAVASGSVPPPPSAPASGTETILVVEDDEAVRSLVARILRSAGYTVLVAATADEAVQASEAHGDKIHLLLTDVIMPGMNGEDLAARLASVRPEMKILFMSGYFDSAIARGGVLRAGVRFIGKPITIETLRQKVRETIDGS